MGSRSVAPPKQWPSWKLAANVENLTQGLVVTGFGSLPTGRALFLEFGGPGERWRKGGKWLGTLNSIAPITAAVPPSKRKEQPTERRAAAIAFTWTGLQRMGLPETALASFSRPFREGMMQIDRLRRLDDRRGGIWRDSVLPGGPLWSANTVATPPRLHPLRRLTSRGSARTSRCKRRSPSTPSCCSTPKTRRRRRSLKIA